MNPQSPLPTEWGPADGRYTRPRVALLWNGVSLEELGLSQFLRSVDMTLTHGRTDPTKRQPSGRPKLGGATIIFDLTTREAAEKLRRMLLANARPFLTVGFGYHDARSYWVGGAQVGTKPDKKKYARVRGYKIGRATWEYATTFPVLTLTGVTGRCLDLLEHKKPSIWSKTTIAEMMKGVATEQGLVVRITGRVSPAQRVDHAVQFAGESRLSALQRFFAARGAEIVVSTIQAIDVPGASVGYEFAFDGEGGPSGAEAQDAVRTMLTIKAIDEQFVDINQLEQARTPVIGWMPNWSPAKFGYADGKYASPPDHVAVKISFDEEGFAVGSTSASGVNATGGVTSVLDGQKNERKTEIRRLPLRMTDSGGVYAGREIEIAPDPVAEGAAVPLESTGSQITEVLVPTATEAEGGEQTTKKKVVASLAARLAAKIKGTVDLTPGDPGLQPGVTIEVRGTYTHDGIYAIEETHTVWDADGLKSTLTIRTPSAIRESTGKKEKPAGAEGAIDPTNPQRKTEIRRLPLRMTDSGGVDAGREIEIAPEATSTEGGDVEGAAVLSEVPSAPGGAAMPPDTTSTSDYSEVQ